MINVGSNMWECMNFTSRRQLKDFPEKKLKKWILDNFLQKYKQQY